MRGGGGGVFCRSCCFPLGRGERRGGKQARKRARTQNKIYFGICVNFSLLFLCDTILF